MGRSTVNAVYITVHKPLRTAKCRKSAGTERLVYKNSEKSKLQSKKKKKESEVIVTEMSA